MIDNNQSKILIVQRTLYSHLTATNVAGQITTQLIESAVAHWPATDSIRGLKLSCQTPLLTHNQIQTITATKYSSKIQPTTQNVVCSETE